MNVTLYGYQEVDFVSNNNEHISGANLFVGFSNRFVTGQKTQKYFISSDSEYFSGVKDIEIGSTIDLVFNDRGKIEDIII